ncbi:unnamed protein product [Clonostachys solani]|uniref:Uncharacterized protein n=1 Tax=Clonostachys solani TaxID=160281 RepID=A0A9N9YWG3_9HYPO|nr:unnamed protein product [Clonostachys solani]
MKFHLAVLGLTMSFGLVAAVDTDKLRVDDPNHPMNSKNAVKAKESKKNSKKAATSGTDCKSKSAKCNLVKCAKAKIFTNRELNEINKRGLLDPRDVDFSSIDTREVSVSDLVAREEFARYDAEDVDHSVRYYLMARDIMDGSDLASGYQTLTRRQGSTATYKFCAKDGAEMKYATPDFPDGNDLYDAAKWEECQNFDLSNKGSDKGGDRKVVDEHVLERQLLTIFAEKKLEGKKIKIDNQEKNMCNYMKETWTNSKILINKRTPLDSVGFAWPNRNEDGKKEMKRLERNIDAVKARAFGKGEIMQKGVIKSLVKGFRGKNRVVATVKAAILAAKYMDEKEINEIYYKQGKRVADALKKAEEEVAKNTKNYQSQNYDELWLTFLKEHTDEVNKKLRDFITNTTKLLNEQVKKEVARKTTKKQTKAKLNAVTAILNEATKYTNSKEGNLFKNPF